MGDGIVYALARDEDGEIETCDCCGSEVPTHTFENTFEPKLALYCEVCSTSYISNIHSFPNLYREEGWRQTSEILQNMAICTNMILEAIRKSKPGETPAS